MSSQGRKFRSFDHLLVAKILVRGLSAGGHKTPRVNANRCKAKLQQTPTNPGIAA
jgi:hypothetical protein